MTELVHVKKSVKGEEYSINKCKAKCMLNKDWIVYLFLEFRRLSYVRICMLANFFPWKKAKVILQKLERDCDNEGIKQKYF